MSGVSLVIVRIILSFLAVAIVAIGISSSFPRIQRKKYMALIVYFVFQLTVQFEIGLHPLLVLAINVFLVFILTLLMTADAKRCLTFSITMFVIWTLSEVAGGGLLSGNQFTYIEYFISGSTITKIWMLVFILIAKRYWSKGKQNLPTLYWLMLLLIPIGSIYIIYQVFNIGFLNQEHDLFTVISALLLLFMNVIIIVVYDRFSYYMEAQRRNQLYEQQLELCNQSAAERAVRNEEVSNIRHNLKEHAITLLGMAKKANCFEIADYIKDNLLPPNGGYQADDVSRTGNIVVDSLVNYKCAIAKSRGISVNASVFVPVNLPFQTGDVSIILGNLLENALDACNDVEKGKRFIKMDVSYDKGMLLITVKNPYKGDRILDKGGMYRTTKGDSLNHGLGLSSVMDAASKYRGELSMNDKDGIFTATVVFFG